MRSGSGQRATSAGIVAFFAGATVAVLQVLEQAVGAFNPQPRVYALIVAAAFCAGLVAARIRSRYTAREDLYARTRHLRSLVGTWPAPLARDADPIRLGVFPPRRAVSLESPYIPRRLDAELYAAMVPGAVIIVLGDPRAGASRTAVEAARTALSDARVITPRTPAALSELLTLDPPVQLREPGALVWLDGLDRFAEVLDGRCLDALAELAQYVTVVATIRRADWDAWLATNGVSGAAARAVAARARVFELTSQLDGNELAVARELYPETDFSAGIGAAIASGGHEAAVPAPIFSGVSGHRREPEPTLAPMRDLQLVGSGALALAALGGLALVVAVSGFSTRSISEQLEAFKREGSSDSRLATTLGGPGGADLHGSNDKSYLVLFTDTKKTKKPRSDELRIFDRHGDTLSPALTFEPRGPRAVFQYRGTHNVDADEADEIVGGYGVAGVAREALVPFAIDWDTRARQYRLIPLDLGPPRLLLDRGRPRPARKQVEINEEAKYRRVYAAKTTFRDPHHPPLTGHPVQDFIVTSSPRRLVAGWFLRPWLGRQDAKVELHVAIFEQTTDAPHLRACTLTGGIDPLVVTFGRDRSAVNVFKRKYAAATHDHNCDPGF